MKYSSILALLFILPTLANSQQLVKGIVTAADTHEPLNGAVITQHHKTLAVSDTKGAFTILLRNNSDTISINFIGFTPLLVTPFNRQQLHIELQRQSGNLGEVTVISNGYQTVTRTRATGSFERIDSALYNRAVSTDILSRLEGITSGLYVAKTEDTKDYFIRGISTLYANTAPLVILDNFPYQGDINDINPNQVQSITVLKDAAAASIWGARSGNGVIVITTKKGQYNRPSHITFNNSLTWEKKPDLFYSRDFMPSTDFIGVEKYLFSQGFYDNDLADVYGYPIISPVVEILNNQRNGVITAGQADAQIQALSKLDLRKDESKYLYRNALRQQYALNVTGGSNTVAYTFDAGYNQDASSMVGNENKRLTLHAATRFQPVNKLEFETETYFTSTKVLNNATGKIVPGQDRYNLYPYAQLADSKGYPLAVPKDYRMAYLDTAGGGLLADWLYRPLQELSNSNNTSATTDVLLKAGLKYSIGEGLTASVSGQYQKSYAVVNNIYNENSYTYRSLYNLYSYSDGTSMVHTIPAGGILDKGTTELTSYSIRGQLDYDKTFQNHHLSALGGAELQQSENNGTATRYYGYNDNILSFSPVDNISYYPLYGNFGYGAVPFPDDLSQTINRYTSIFANASYSYKNIYTLTGSARKDASNLFGIAANKRGVPLWSAGGSWKISGEEFYHIKWLSSLLLRTTYGYSGNVRSDVAAVPTLTYDGTDPPTYLNYASINNLSNPLLRWEKTGMLNVGIDFNMFHDRLSGTVEYYNKKSFNLLAPAPIDPTLGFDQLIINSAHLTGKGTDIKINWLIINRKLKWNSQLLFNYVSNKVTRYLLSKTGVPGSYAGYGTVVTPVEGKDPYAIISYRFAGLDATGNPVGYYQGKKSTSYSDIVTGARWNDLAVRGTSRPPLFGSLLESFGYRNWELSFVIAYKFKYYFRRSTINYYALYNDWQMNTDFEKRWKKPGDESKTDIPSMAYPVDSYRDQFFQLSSATVEKGDLVRLQDVNLTYNFLNNKLFKNNVGNIQLYLYAGNLPILWRANKLGIDPDYQQLPPAMNITFGIRANF